MIRRPASILAIAAAFMLAVLVAACSSASTGPVLTDPTAIVTAALTSVESAKSVHVELAASGTATVPLPIAGSSGTPIDLTGTTASADVDLTNSAAKVTFAVPTMLGLAGEAIVVDGKLYLKTSITGQLYQEMDLGGAAPSSSQAPGPSPSMASGMIDNLGNVLLKQGVTLVKGDDVACGSTQCYTVTADLDPSKIAPTASGSIAGVPIDLSGATVKLTLHVEKDLPNHLAGVTAEVTTPSNGSAKIDLTFSKWDQPVTITAPPADQIKPAS